ncbi:hypothetical protein ACFXHD_09830 [Streptomyces hydrogenans]|uniref:hypothetical protein n=1 Tax=Streptomyces hydrogenans TaxID=1873719 RepID=UPI0036C4DC8F
MSDFSDPDFEDGWTSTADARAERAERELAALKRAHVALAEQAGKDQATIARVREALESVHRAMVHDPRDWGRYKRDAWTYGVIVGWECEEHHEHDDICFGAEPLAKIIRQHGWLPADVARLKAYRTAIHALKGTS